MKFRLVEELHEVAYMIRRDGKVFTTQIHPYLALDRNKYQFDTVSDQASLFDFIQNINVISWYYNCTQHQQIKEYIECMAVSYIDYQCGCSADERQEMLQVIKFPNQLLSLLDSFHKDINQIEKKFSAHDVFANIVVNFYNEFLRARYGGEYINENQHGSIYFRVSSFDFNWIDVIYQFVTDNKRQISDITIETDEQSGRDLHIYGHGRYKFDHMPTDEFLTMKGTPLIESVDTKNNKKLSEFIEIGKVGNPVNVMNFWFSNRMNDTYQW